MKAGKTRDKRIFVKTVLQRASVRCRLRNLQDRGEGGCRGSFIIRDEMCVQEFKHWEIII